MKTKSVFRKAAGGKRSPRCYVCGETVKEGEPVIIMRVPMGRNPLAFKAALKGQLFRYRHEKCEPKREGKAW